MLGSTDCWLGAGAEGMRSVVVEDQQELRHGARNAQSTYGERPGCVKGGEGNEAGKAKLGLTCGQP